MKNKISRKAVVGDSKENSNSQYAGKSKNSQTKKSSNKYLNNISNGSNNKQNKSYHNHPHNPNINNLSIGSQSDEPNDHNNNSSEKNKGFYSNKQSKTNPQNKIIFTNQFSVSPSNADRIYTDSSNSKLFSEDQQLQQQQ